jgi:dolichol-phosphate mannosyltransferase
LPDELLLSVVIPARNEEKHLAPTVEGLCAALGGAGIPFEIVIVDDQSSDGTRAVGDRLAVERPEVRIIPGGRLPGFGRAVRAGLAAFRGDAVVVVMADQSDDPADVVRYYRKLQEGYDCVFGSRFRRGSSVTNYPRLKLVFNRIVNRAIQLLFWTRFNDLTNAFKVFRREVVEECGPYSSSHFNLTIEMSLSALIRRYWIAEIPVSWSGRTWGASKLSLWEMGRRYLSVLLKLFFDRMLISDDLMDERLVARRGSSADRDLLEARIAALEKRVHELSQPEPPSQVSEVRGSWRSRSLRDL